MSNKLWHPEFLRRIKESPELLEDDWEKFLDAMVDLDFELKKYIVKNGISTKKIRCRVCNNSGPNISISIRKMILGLEELGLITSDEVATKLESWKLYRKKHSLDRDGGRRFKSYPPCK